MDRSYRVPYGQETLHFELPESVEIEILEPAIVPAAGDPQAAVEAALEAPLGGVSLDGYRGAQSAAIAISDKTRPVPHHDLLPPLLRRLVDLGLSHTDIHILIATGLHERMKPAEYGAILPPEILAQYPVDCHSADAQENLVWLGETRRGTPVWVNRSFMEADLRLVVGDIEPHQFQGFSGGVKSAAIGLAGRDTINANHSMMDDPGARMIF